MVVGQPGWSTRWFVGQPEKIENSKFGLSNECFMLIVLTQRALLK